MDPSVLPKLPEFVELPGAPLFVEPNGLAVDPWDDEPNGLVVDPGDDEPAGVPIPPPGVEPDCPAAAVISSCGL